MKVLAILFVIWGLIAHTFAQQPATWRLSEYVKNINRFATECPQEKVYLHFDNTGYYVGDTIWFKAYAVYAETVKPTTLSRVLHVELVTPRGEIVDSRKLKIENGQCHGEFALSRDYRGGFYEVRAYTRGMLNFGDDYIFSRVFPVYSAPEIAGNYEEKEMDSFFGEKKERPSPETFDKVNIAFFPEGGHVVKGLRSRIAFRTTGKNGEDICVTGKLYNKVGEQVAVLSTLHQGMGVFELTPEEDEYKAVMEYEGKSYTLPFKEVLSEGYTMNVNNMRSESLQITMRKSKSLPYDTIAVSVSCRGRVYAVEAFGLSEEPYTFSVSKEKFPAGCLQITAFNTDGDILAERLAFHTKPNMYIPIKVTQDKSAYKPFEEINMEFDIHDHAGNPVETTFSLAIRDAATAPVTAYQDNMLTNLLLSSEVKGYIENPMQYFTDNSRVTRMKLDLLMMVQGWRRYSWQQMAGVKPFEVKHFVEEGLPLWGRVLGLVGNKPRANVNLLFWMKNDSLKAEIHGKGHTDEKGNFYCILPDTVDLTGKWLLNISVSEEGKQKQSRILINRSFTPETRSYSYWDRLVKINSMIVEDVKDSLHKSPITEMQSLPEVQVRKSRIRSALKPDIVLDVETEISKALDRGADIPNQVGDYLESRYPIINRMDENNLQTELKKTYNPRYEYGRGSQKRVGFRYLCRKENADKFRSLAVSQMDIENVERIMIYTDERMDPFLSNKIPEGSIQRRLPEMLKGNGGYECFQPDGCEVVDIDEIIDASPQQRAKLLQEELHPAAIVVVKLYDEVYNNTRKGIRQTYYTGYSPVRECYNSLTEEQAIGDINYRRTLYWSPDVKTDSEGKATIRFYNNGTCRQIDVSTERGITKGENQY